MGRYELLYRLAMGGMAELYVARHSGIEGFERTVVLKRVLPHLTDDPEFIRMFLDEARIAASLDHPNIAQVTDIDEENGEYFFAMEYVHGQNLRQVLRKTEQGLPLGIALLVITGVAAGLHHAHEALGADGRSLGLVHRDVSPANVMLAYNGAVKLTDFGIAKASARTSKTLAGRIKGKIGYMSPEQCRGEDVCRRSDIFSLGIVLYEATTGARAFYAPNDFAAMAKIARADYIVPSELDASYPVELERIIARALAKDPDDRYATAEAMQLDLEAFAEADGHALSTIELSAHMRRAFGEQPHPQTLPTTPIQVSAGLEHTMVAPQAPRTGVSATVLWSAVAGSAVLAATMVLALGPSRDSDASPAPRQPTEVSTPTAQPPPEAEVSVTTPTAQSDPRVPEAPTPLSTDEVVTGVAVAQPATEADEAPPTKRKHRRKRKPTKKSKSSARSPYPPGYER